MRRSRPIANAAISAFAVFLATVGAIGLGPAASAESGGGYLGAHQDLGAQGRIGRPLSSRINGGRPAPGARTVPTFETSFDVGGTTYPLTIVGTNPVRDASTTIVPTVIVPLRVEFPDGSVFDGARRVSQVVASPLFQPADFITGHTQFGDAPGPTTSHAIGIGRR